MKKDDLKKEEEVAKYEGKSGQIIVGSFNEAPTYLQDNEYIKKGYRVNCDSLKKATKSLFVLHNESVNIWSHLLGAISIIILIVYTAFFISSYKTQLMNISTHFDQINKKLIPLFDIDNIQIKSIASTLTNLTTDYLNDLTTKFSSSSIFKNYIDIINTSILKIKNSTNTLVNKNNISISFTDYIDELGDKLIRIKEQIIKLAEMEQLTFESSSSSTKSKQYKRWPLFIMLSSAIACLSFSATFHALGTLSKQMHNIFSRLDYAGISLLIAGSCYPPYYYFYYCEPFLKVAYLSFITVFAIGVFLYSFTETFQLPKMRAVRGTLFLVLGLSAGAPVFHLALPNRIRGFDVKPRLFFWEFGGISYIIGAILYIRRIPEKFIPGKFDIFGSSHQIFHFLIVVGVISHYIGCLDAYYYRFDNECPIY